MSSNSAVTGNICHITSREVITNIGCNPGGWGVTTPRFWAGGRGGCGRVVKHCYILSCTGSMFESGDLSSEIE